MKKYLLLLFVCFILTNLYAADTYFAAAKAGLSLREAPNTTAKILDKIAYGQQVVTVNDTAASKQISTEGFNGYWWKVSCNGKTGYVVSSYLLPLAPPKPGTKGLKEYFAQISTAVGSPVLVKREYQDMNLELTKQLYKNGAEWHEFIGYEYGTATFFIPDFTLEQAYLLVRLTGQYKDIISENDPFPAKNSITKNSIGQRAVKVQRENWGDGKQGPVERIKIENDEGAITSLEIFIMDNQAVIYWSSGV